MRVKLINRTDFRTNDLIKSCGRFFYHDYSSGGRKPVCVIVAYDGDENTKAEVVSNTLLGLKTHVLFIPRDCTKEGFVARVMTIATTASWWVQQRYVTSTIYKLRPKADKDQRDVEAHARLKEQVGELKHRIERARQYAGWYPPDSFYRKRYEAQAMKNETQLYKVQKRLAALEAKDE